MTQAIAGENCNELAPEPGVVPRGSTEFVLYQTQRRCVMSAGRGDSNFSCLLGTSASDQMPAINESGAALGLNKSSDAVRRALGLPSPRRSFQTIYVMSISLNGDSEASAARRGILAMLGSSLAFSLMSLGVKCATETLPVSEVVFSRSFITLALSFIWLRAAGLSVRGRRTGLLILRGLFGFLGLTCFFSAIDRLDLLAATTLHYLNPIVTALIAAWLLRERLRLRVVFSLILGFVGVLFVAKPGALFASDFRDPPDAIGVALALSGALFAAAAYVTVRKLRESESPAVIVLYFPLISIPCSLPALLFEFKLPNLVESWWLLGVGVMTFLGQVGLTYGLKWLPAGRAMSLGYTQIALSGVWGWSLLGEEPSPLAILGAILIGFGAVLAAGATKRNVNEKRPDHSTAGP